MQGKSLCTGLTMFVAACGTAEPPAAASGNGANGGIQGSVQPVSETSGDRPFKTEILGRFDEPWAAAFMPGTSLMFITEKSGRVKFVDVRTNRLGSIQSGLPEVDYGGQGGLGDIAFGPGWKAGQTSGGPLYLTWAEAGEGSVRGAALGRGTLICEEADACRLEGLQVLWRQDKVTGRGHYSHRIAFSPDGEYLFLTSGDRQKMEPAQDLTTNLGKVLRLTLDGKPAPGNPWSDRGGKAAEFWSMGHRNLLGIDFAPDGRLWQVEMGPQGGDELNLVVPGRNYGWPQASYGSHYDGRDIPDDHSGRGFEEPKAWWNPVISPGGMLIYTGTMFPQWKDDALIAALSGQSLIRVDIAGDRAQKAGEWDMDARIRAVDQGPDGAIYLLEDGRSPGQGRLLRLTPAS